MELIKSCLINVRGDVEFRINVMADYNNLGISLLENKSAVMRQLSQKYAKADMKRVYNVIWGEVTANS